MQILCITIRYGGLRLCVWARDANDSKNPILGPLVGDTKGYCCTLWAEMRAGCKITLPFTMKSLFNCYITHICDNLIGLCVWWRWRWGWWWGQDLWVSAIQVLDALLVILTQPQRVGERVVGRHDSSLLTRVLQAQNMPKFMGSHLEKVCACGCSRQDSEDAKPHLIPICFDLFMAVCRYLLPNTLP